MTHEINLPKSPKIVQEFDNFVAIQIDGCYPGYGITLANSLRRILLSSLPGTAIVAFRIKGIEHEFSTIPYVMEDIIKIGITLKKVCFVSQESLFDERVQANIKVKGEKKILAGDIKVPAGIEVVNKNLHIATLTDKKAELEMELFISGGYGYERSEEREKEKLPIGTIALDAIYAPITRVSYKIEDMRIGKRTDFNRVIMKIQTDGSIKPVDAFNRASSILEKHFAFLGKTKNTKKEKITSSKKIKLSKKVKGVQLAPKKLSDLGIDDKIIKILEKNGIKSVAGLIKKKDSFLKEIKGIGSQSINNISKQLKKFNLALKS
jgi:DNA-directed RNA polymerase subunit alpha